ncbi:MAG: hypothetical protein JNM00_09160 [Flavobacteriales bacterium]|nr:hypothetical protein [Flavobacteriales bacterium]
MEDEIIAYHQLQAKIANLESQLLAMEKDIIQKYCPFKVGEKVTYRESLSAKDRHGIIQRIAFNGVKNEAIYRRWRIVVMPTTKDYKPILGRYHVHLGTHGTDSISPINQDAIPTV